jgi:nucleoside-diphosphate-sugar epimerase
MARVVVTGGAGKLGRACVDELVRHGWDVVVFDRVRPPSDSAAVFVPIDLADYGQVLDAMLGVEERYARSDALVHLAAVPAPGIVPDHLTFMNNIACTWNVLSAARRAGVINIVWASSETVLGLPFETPPPYIPVDEEHECPGGARANSEAQCSTWVIEPTMQKLRADCITELIRLQFGRSFK